jgi:hypothetical protein
MRLNTMHISITMMPRLNKLSIYVPFLR